MELAFATTSLKELCEQEKLARRELGADSAKKLRARLADLRAAASVTDVVAGRPHPLSGDRAGEFAVSLAGGHRLVFKPNHDPTPMLDDGGIDWANVTRVTVVFIGDYHG